VCAGVLAVGLGGLNVVSAAFAQYGEGGSSGALVTNTSGTPISTIAQGQSFIIKCFDAPCADDGANAKASVQSNTVVLGTMTANNSGSYSGTFRMPTSVSVGTHSIVVDTTLDGDPITYSRQIRVTAAAGTGTSLPKTGMDIAILVAWGLALVALGWAIVVGARRKLRAMRTAKLDSARTQERRETVSTEHR
jgi:LPXTG-motif cell wall-anchored protein